MARKLEGVQVTPEHPLFIILQKMLTAFGFPALQAYLDVEEFREQWQAKESTSQLIINRIGNDIIQGGNELVDVRQFSESTLPENWLSLFEAGFRAWQTSPKVVTVFTNRLGISLDVSHQFVRSSVRPLSYYDRFELKMGKWGSEERYVSGKYFGLIINTNHDLANPEAALVIPRAELRELILAFVDIGRYVEQAKINPALVTDAQFSNWIGYALFGFSWNRQW